MKRIASKGMDYDVVLYSLLLFLFVGTANQMFSQEMVIWNIDKNKVSSLLPTDTPFQIKIKSKSGFTEGPYSLIIWDRKNEKRIEEKLENDNGFPIRLDEKMNHTMSKLYISDSIVANSDTLLIINAPTILSANRSYTLFLTGLRTLNTQEYAELIEYFEEEDYLAESFSLFADALIDDGLSNYNEVFQNFYKEDLPYFIRSKITEVNKRYTYTTPSDEEISMVLDEMNIFFGILLGLSSSAAENAVETTNMVEGLSYFVEGKGIEAIDSAEFEDLNIAFSDLIDHYKFFLKNIIRDHALTHSVIATTYERDLVKRTSKRITSTFGFGLVVDGINKPYTTLGLNYHFKPINREVSVHDVSYTFGSYLQKRFSIYAAVSFVDLNGDLFNNEDRFGLVNNQSVVGGLGYMPTDGIMVNAGALLFNQGSKNPLIDNKQFAAAWQVTLSIDLSLRETFNKQFKKKENE